MLELAASDLFYRFLDTAPLACFALFADSATRPYFWDKEILEKSDCSTSDSVMGLGSVPQWHLKEYKKETLDNGSSIKRLNMLNVLIGLVSDNSRSKAIFGDYLQIGVIAGGTHDYEFKIKSKGKYMVLAFTGDTSCPFNIASADRTDTYDYSTSKGLILYGLLVLDGIRANKSSSDNVNIYYMEAR